MDPRLSILWERFVALEPPAAGTRLVMPFFEGDDVLHLYVATFVEIHLRGQVIVDTPWSGVRVALPDGSFHLGSTVEIYLSPNGVKLLNLARTRSPANGVEAILFLEVNRGDALSGTVFEITPSDGVGPERFLSLTSHIAPILRQQMRLSVGGYNALVESRFDDGSTVGDRALRFFLRQIGGALSFAGGQIAGLATHLDATKMPHELWDPKRQPKDWAELLARTGKQLDNTVDALLGWLAALEPLNLSHYLDDLPWQDALPEVLTQTLGTLKAALQKIEAMWNAVLGFIADAAAVIKLHRPDAADSLGTLIGYICGVWDGLVDTLAGLLDLGALGLKLAGETLKAAASPRTTVQLVLEAIDQTLAAFMRVDWVAVWGAFVEELPRIVELVKTQAAEFVGSLVRHSASAGYYFGYLVYNLAEAFFPPLKASKAAKATSGAAMRTSDFLTSALPAP